MRGLFKIFLPAALLSAAVSCTGDEIEVVHVSNLASAGLEWSAPSYEATIGAENQFPTLTATEIGKLTISYSSSADTVATIDENGNITLLKAGNTSITATSAQTKKYDPGTASYVLTVVRSADGISWSASSCTVNIGDTEHEFPVLSNPGGQSITYSSSNESVATIDSDGNITLVAEGASRIVATAAANDSYDAGTASFTLTVEGTHKAAGLNWSDENCTATLKSDDNTFPTLSNPNGLDISYSSSDTNVASIDASGGITLVSAGTVAIIASSEADDSYAAGSASYTLKVVKHDVTLSWSEDSFKAVLEEDNDYPELAADPSALLSEVEYQSSDESIAAIDASGNITLGTSTGKVTISAVFSGNDYYKAASASYALTVVSGNDEGAGTYTFDSAGDTSSEDDISLTTFSRLITVSYSTSGDAEVTGDYYGYASVSGNHVTVNNSGDEFIVYKLTGTTTNGSFKLYSSRKQAIWLSGASITNTSGAAINNQSGKRTFVYVEGTNTLADGSSAAYSATGTEDLKGVFFSEGQLCFSGSGSLTVTANNKQSKSAIVSDDYVRFMSSPTIKVTAGSSAGHGIRGNDYVQISNGTLTVSTSANMKKGIASDGYVLVEGGTTAVTVSGGVAYDSEDGEYKGSAGVKADNYFAMTGGTLTITNSGKGGKGVRAGSESFTGNGTAGLINDSYISGGTLTVTTTGSESNDVSCKGIKIGWAEGTENKVTANDGSLTISGGIIKVSSSKSEGLEVKDALTVTGGELYVTSTGDDAVNCVGEMNISGGYVYANSTANDALDSNSNLTLSGGYVFAVTTAGGAEVAIDCAEQKTLTIGKGVVMVAYPSIESGATMNQSCYTFSATAGNWNALHNGSSYIAAFKAPSGISSFVVSAPSLDKGYKGASVSGTTYCNGIWAISGISGGTSTSLTSYSGGNSGGGGGGGGGGGFPGGGGGGGGGPR